MSNVVRKRLEPCQKSLQRLSDVALCARKGKKRKMKGNQIWEKITAHTENRKTSILSLNFHTRMSNFSRNFTARGGVGARRGRPGRGRRGGVQPAAPRAADCSGAERGCQPPKTAQRATGKTAGEECPFFAAVFLHELGEGRGMSEGAAAGGGGGAERGRVDSLGRRSCVPQAGSRAAEGILLRPHPISLDRYILPGFVSLEVMLLCKKAPSTPAPCR